MYATWELRQWNPASPLSMFHIRFKEKRRSPELSSPGQSVVTTIKDPSLSWLKSLLRSWPSCSVLWNLFLGNMFSVWMAHVSTFLFFFHELSGRNSKFPRYVVKTFQIARMQSTSISLEYPNLFPHAGYKTLVLFSSSFCSWSMWICQK